MVAAVVGIVVSCCQDSRLPMYECSVASTLTSVRVRMAAGARDVVPGGIPSFEHRGTCPHVQASRIVQAPSNPTLDLMYISFPRSHQASTCFCEMSLCFVSCSLSPPVPLSFPDDPLASMCLQDEFLAFVGLATLLERHCLQAFMRVNIHQVHTEHPQCRRACSDVVVRTGVEVLGCWLRVWIPFRAVQPAGCVHRCSPHPAGRTSASASAAVRLRGDG